MSQGSVSIGQSSTATAPTVRPVAVPTPHGWAARQVERLLAAAGIAIDGPQPWDIQVHDSRLYARLITGGITALGDAYVDGWWDAQQIDQFFDRALTHGLPQRVRLDGTAILHRLKHALMNQQSRLLARRNVERHYDLGNDLFVATLDPHLVYTCGYWKNATTLDAAQEAKLDLVCRKINLRPGQRVLDAGCGWGSFARYAAEKYGAHVVGVTLSQQQVEWGSRVCQGLPVEIRLQDYRDVNEQFDHIVSIGMLEHVGPRNYRQFARHMHRCLRDDGLMLLHYFAGRTCYPRGKDSEAVWIQQHIFPGLVVPSLKQIGAAIDDLFVIEDLHNFGADYDPTLMAWFANFDRNWPSIQDKYGPRFYRMWKYYLLSCAGAFRSRKYQLWQMVLSKTGVRGGYSAVR